MSIKDLFDSLIGILPKMLDFLYTFKIYGDVNLLGVMIAFTLITMCLVNFMPGRGR